MHCLFATQGALQQPLPAPCLLQPPTTSPMKLMQLRILLFDLLQYIQLSQALQHCAAPTTLFNSCSFYKVIHPCTNSCRYGILLWHLQLLPIRRNSICCLSADQSSISMEMLAKQRQTCVLGVMRAIMGAVDTFSFLTLAANLVCSY